MLRGFLNALSEVGDPLPRYTSQRCLLVKQTVGGCDKCFQSCPHKAIEILPHDQGIELLPEACTGCGLCVQVCPAGALEYDPAILIQSVRDQHNQHKQATLTCSKSELGGPQVPCLARVTPTVMLATGALELPLALVHGDCQGCPMGAPEVPEQLAKAAETALQFNKQVQVNVRSVEKGEVAKEAQFSRRQAFGSLFKSGQKQLAQQLPERPLPFVDWSVPTQRIPLEWQWRKLVLSQKLKTSQIIYWPAPIVDDSCIDCPVCANVCPTEAITRDLQPDGGVQLLLNLEACTGCKACIHSCPAQAMHQQTEWFSAAFESEIVLRESDSVM